MMIRSLYLLLFIFLGLTIFDSVIHIQSVPYFINISNPKSNDIYTGQVSISNSLQSYDTCQYTLSVWFYKINEEIILKDIRLIIVQKDQNDSFLLRPFKIRAYSGMETRAYPEFFSFSEIPDSLKKITKTDNPYFAYDFIFVGKNKGRSTSFSENVAIDFTENGKALSIRKNITIQVKYKSEILPWDMHSDFTYLFIPFFGLISIILAFIILILKYRRWKL